MYVGPLGSTAFGQRYKLPGAAPSPSAPATPAGSPATHTVQLGPAAIAQLANAYAAKNPGWTPPAAAGLVAHPGAPGTQASAPATPYMTGQNLIDYGTAFKDHADQIAGADKTFADLQAQAQTALYNIGQNYLHGVDNTQNDAAARGIFQSSIKDGALADLAATKATMASDVNTRINNAQLFHDTAIKNVNDWWNNFQDGMNSIKVENASATGPGDPGTPAGPTTYSLPPVAPSPAPALTAAQKTWTPTNLQNLGNAYAANNPGWTPPAG